MKKYKFLYLVLLIIILFSCKKKNDNVLTVVSYSSFASAEGAGEKIKEEFKTETGIDVNIISVGSGAELASFIKNKNNKDKFDVVVGLQDIDLDDEIIKLFDEIKVFDYSYYAFLINKDSNLKRPESLQELTTSLYDKKVILIDPRTSSVGLGLLYWTYSSLGEEKCISWWKSMLENDLTEASSWSSAYGLFLSGEAPIVISYVTSPLYDIFQGNTPFCEPLYFKDGHIRTNEYVATSIHSKNKDKAEKFVKYMLNSKSQEILSKINIMYPGNKEAFKQAFDYVKEPQSIETAIISKEELLNIFINKVL